MLGLKGEPTKGGVDGTILSFPEQVKMMLGARMVITVLSSWAAAAAVFGKKQLVVSFTDDVHAIRNNPFAEWMVCPTREELTEKLKKEGVC